MANVQHLAEQLHPPLSPQEVADIFTTRARVVNLLTEGLAKGCLAESFKKISNDLGSIYHIEWQTLLRGYRHNNPTDELDVALDIQRPWLWELLEDFSASGTVITSTLYTKFRPHIGLDSVVPPNRTDNNPTMALLCPKPKPGLNLNLQQRKALSTLFHPLHAS
ncbi:hypothetical protein BJ165DRAFT_1534664 [Panaeolus papilionaceus]|nr:hypothetical protein BJ165DRAFT_1534664 [Panaeolus papilionaceus]